MQRFRYQNKWFTFGEVSTIVIDLLDGYHQLSSVEIVHQDIKPDNILINKNIFKIADFGLSLRLGVDKKELGGSLFYNAPEKYRGILDAKSDVYALGIIFYQLLYDEHPYIA